MRFAFYNRITTENQEDPEQAARCQALIEATMAEYLDTAAATYFEDDGRESPYCRTADQPALTPEKPIS